MVTVPLGRATPVQLPVEFGGVLQARVTVTSSAEPEFRVVTVGVMVIVGVSTWKNLTMTEVEALPGL
jgi:hypothetical protein